MTCPRRPRHGTRHDLTAGASSHKISDIMRRVRDPQSASSVHTIGDWSGVFRKMRRAVGLYRERGPKAFVVALKRRYSLPIPVSTRFRWEAGIPSEIEYWDKWLRTNGLRPSDDYRFRLDPHARLQAGAAVLLPSWAEWTAPDLLDSFLGGIC